MEDGLIRISLFGCTACRFNSGYVVRPFMISSINCPTFCFDRSFGLYPIFAILTRLTNFVTVLRREDFLVVFWRVWLCSALSPGGKALSNVGSNCKCNSFLSLSCFLGGAAWVRFFNFKPVEVLDSQSCVTCTLERVSVGDTTEGASGCIFGKAFDETTGVMLTGPCSAILHRFLRWPATSSASFKSFIPGSWDTAWVEVSPSDVEFPYKFTKEAFSDTCPGG